MENKCTGAMPFVLSCQAKVSRSKFAPRWVAHVEVPYCCRPGGPALALQIPPGQGGATCMLPCSPCHQQNCTPNCHSRPSRAWLRELLQFSLILMTSSKLALRSDQAWAVKRRWGVRPACERRRKCVSRCSPSRACSCTAYPADPDCAPSTSAVCEHACCHACAGPVHMASVPAHCVKGSLWVLGRALTWVCIFAS